MIMDEPHNTLVGWVSALAGPVAGILGALIGWAYKLISGHHDRISKLEMTTVSKDEAHRDKEAIMHKLNDIDKKLDVFIASREGRE